MTRVTKAMSELTRFFGIIIAMDYNDHSPPHFHAKYGDDQAVIRIDTGEVIEGNLSARALDRASGVVVMIPRVVEVKPLANFCLWVCFMDGTSGTVDLAQELWGPMFEPLANPDLFHQAMVDPELETVVWPNGADLSPEFLYQMALQTPGKII
jgi:hypothetical protein